MARTREVTAKVPQKKDSEGKVTQEELVLTVSVPWGETPDETVEMFGSEAVDSNAWGNARVTIQSGIRSALKRGEAPTEIQERYKTWKLGVAMQGGKIDAEAAFKAKFAAATPAEKKKMIAMLRELAE